MITVRLRKDGPYVIDGDEVRVVDWDGTEHRSPRQPVALCRCGHSSSKPFCDGSHAGGRERPVPPRPDPR